MTDLSRCSRCGRTGTSTSLSAGNTCLIVEPCDAARQDAIDRAAHLSRDDATKKKGKADA